MTQEIQSLSEDEKEFLWRAYRDFQIKGLGIDPALFSDFFPKLKKNEFDFSGIGMMPSVPIGIVDKIRKGGKITSEKPKVEEAKAKEVKPVVVEKTNFNVILKGFNPESKIKIIKEIKNLMGLGLKESKDFVESCLKEPVTIFKNATAEKANELEKFFKDLGAHIELK